MEGDIVRISCNELCCCKAWRSRSRACSREEVCDRSKKTKKVRNAHVSGALVDLISIIMPAYNGGRFIGEAIESVKAQTYPNWELLIIDDGSSDNTPSIVSEYAKYDARLRLLRSPENRGPARARNIGIKEAHGRYIAFLDSDDKWLPRKLQVQIARMEQTGAVFCYTAYRMMDENGDVRRVSITVPTTVTYNGLLKNNCVGCLTAIYDASVLGTMFMPEDRRHEDERLWRQIVGLMRHHEDYALWLSILRKIDAMDTEFASSKVIGINEVFALYRVRGDSITGNKLRSAAFAWAVYRGVEKLSLFKSLYYFLHYAINGYRKRRGR